MSLVTDNIFDPDVNKYLSKSSKLYRESYLKWREFNRYLGYIAPKKAGTKKDNRQRGADAIRKALNCEQDAIKQIEISLQKI